MHQNIIKGILYHQQKDISSGGEKQYKKKRKRINANIVFKKTFIEVK